MSVNLALKASTDGGNSAVPGSDNGLYVPPRALTGATLENWMNGAGGSGSAFYQQATQSVVATPMTSGTAWVWPVMFTRACYMNNVYVNVTTAGASSTIYLSAYASDPYGAVPGAKLMDYGQITGATVQAVALTANAQGTSYLWQANTVYFLCAWAVVPTAAPQITMRTGGHLPLRQPTAPTAATAFTTTLTTSYLDTSSGWSNKSSAPAGLVLAQGYGTANTASQYAPNLIFQLTNA